MNEHLEQGRCTREPGKVGLGNSDGVFRAERMVCSLGATEGFAQFRCGVPAIRCGVGAANADASEQSRLSVLPNACAPNVVRLGADKS